MQECLNSLLLFDQLDPSSKRKIASEMYERTVVAGDILIKEGDTGLAANELYVVKTGEFEVRSWCAAFWNARWQQAGPVSARLRASIALSCEP